MPLAVAKRIGYPVMIKAIAGGGGRGMRAAHNDVSLVKGFHTARSEAEKAFGKSGVYIEKFIENSHHIEFQIFGDNKGNYIHLGERDCSIQRRNQKLVEETPSPLLEAKFKDLRKKMGKAAVRIAEVAHYTNAGTVEFLVDEKGHYYFLEVNKRIQVEHPITEEVTGMDLVKMQIAMAMGEPLAHQAGRRSLAGDTPSNAASTRKTRSMISGPAPAGWRCTTRPGGPRHAGGQPCLCRLHHPADLRFDDRQAHHASAKTAAKRWTR